MQTGVPNYFFAAKQATFSSRLGGESATKKLHYTSTTLSVVVVGVVGVGVASVFLF